MLRPPSPAVKTLARTCSANQWADDAFYAYVERKLIESRAEVTQDNITTLFTAVLVYAIPAGNG